MGKLGRGIIAGVAATVVLSIFMMIKAQAHLLPAFNAIGMIHSVVGGPPITGWVGHFVIGALLWGVLFALLCPALPGGRGFVKGLVFGVLAWLVMMTVFLPVAGAGFFGLAIGPRVIVAALTLHFIYGAVLGWTYAALGGHNRVYPRDSRKPDK